MLFSGGCGVEEDKGTASAVPDTPGRLPTLVEHCLRLRSSAPPHIGDRAP